MAEAAQELRLLAAELASERAKVQRCVDAMPLAVQALAAWAAELAA